MKRILLGVMAAMLAAGAQSSEAERQLKAAVNAELVNGDLKAAIRQYGEIAAKYKNDRAVAAMALVHMAECYRKMGDAEARKVYELVLRNYADQQDAVQIARAGLNRGEAEPGHTAIRQVWIVPPGGDPRGRISRDGRYFAYIGWEQKGDLFLHDLRTGVDRRLTDTAGDVPGGSGEFAGECAFSPDQKQLAYAWWNGKDHYEIRIIDLKGTGLPPHRRLFADADVKTIGPYDWSPDGKWLAVGVRRTNNTYQIGLLSVADARLTILRTLDVRHDPKMAFSPDGRHIAFDTKSRDTQKRDIFVVSMNDLREIPAVVNPNDDSLLGWSPDGKRLLFASDRTGSNALWSLRFEGGKPVGDPEFIRGLETTWGMGVTASGSLYVGTDSGNSVSDIQIARFDFRNGRFLSPPVQAVPEYVGSNHQPMLSPDGKYLSYVSRRGPVGSSETVLCIRSLETGRVTELRPKLLNYAQGWTPDGKSLIANGTDSEGHQGNYRVDRETGEATPFLLAQPGEKLSLPQWSSDAKKIYIRHVTGRESTFVERDVVSGRERVIVPRGADLRGGWLMSPDRLHVAVSVYDRDRQSTAIVLYSVGGSAPRELMRATRPEEVSALVWARDSSSLYLRKGPFREHNVVWRVPLDGSQPQQIDLNVDNINGLLAAYPNGDRVAIETFGTRQPIEVWALENFLPELSARK